MRCSVLGIAEAHCIECKWAVSGHGKCRTWQDIEEEVPFSEVIWTFKLLPVLQRQLSHEGEGDRGRIGVQYMSIAQENSPLEGAAQIIHVVPGSAAEEAGIQRGDVVLAVDGNVLERECIILQIELLPAGLETLVTLKIQRGWRRKWIFEIAVEELPGNQSAHRRPTGRQGSSAALDGRNGIYY